MQITWQLDYLFEEEIEMPKERLLEIVVAGFLMLGFMKRFEKAMNIVWPQVMKFKYLEQAAYIKVPVFFIGGRYDRDTPNNLVEEYCVKMNAPKKEFNVFENSAHLAPFEEPEALYRVFREKVLKNGSM